MSSKKVVQIPVPENWKEMPAHPLAELSDFGVGIDVDGLAASIKNNGYDTSEPITVREKDGVDMIGDGRHRRAACIAADVVPNFQRFNGTDVEFLRFVVKKVNRIHLNPSQIAMLLSLSQLEGKKLGLDGKTEESATLHSGTIQEQADTAGASRRLCFHSKNVAEKGSKALISSVKDGTVKVSDAAKILDQPAAVQKQAVRDVVEGKSRTVAGAVKRLNIMCQRCTRIGESVQDCKACERALDAFDKAERKKKLRANKEKKAALDPKTDDFGNEVPSHLRDAWADPWIQTAFDYIALACESWRLNKFGTAMQKRAKHYPFFKLEDFATGVGSVGNTMEQLFKHLRDNRPSGVCPACDGKKCPKCRESGLVPRETYLAMKKDKKPNLQTA